MTGTPHWAIQGIVVDSSGAPVSMASVSIASGPVPTADIAALTGPDGRFSIDVSSSGRFEIVVCAPGFAVLRLNINATETTSPADSHVKIRLGGR